MQFGRVYGVVTQRPAGMRWLTVVLDTGRDLRAVRDEPVPPLVAAEEPSWLADQLVQGSIDVELALEGWEVIGEEPSGHEGNERAIGRSSVWIVRRA